MGCLIGSLVTVTSPIRETNSIKKSFDEFSLISIVSYTVLYPSWDNSISCLPVIYLKFLSVNIFLSIFTVASPGTVVNETLTIILILDSYSFVLEDRCTIS